VAANGPPIWHVVLLRPRPGAEEAAISRLRGALAALLDAIPGITGLEFGPNVSPEGKGRGFDLGFVMTFEDAAARDAYLPHPDHVAVGPYVEAVAEEVLVFDIERREVAERRPGVATPGTRQG
jgi:hypothetical protein